MFAAKMVADLESLHPSLRLARGEIEAFCRKWKIAKLEIFGSALREDFSSASDVDFLYTLAPGAEVGWEIAEMQEELSRIVGREVDLLSRHGVERSENWIRRPAILASARAIYEA